MEFSSPSFFVPLIVSVVSFIAVEFFFPELEDNALSKKQKHFWSCTISILVFFQGIVLGQLFEFSASIDTKLAKYDDKVLALTEHMNLKTNDTTQIVTTSKEQVVKKVEDFSLQTNKQYETINTSIKSFNGMFGSIAGIEDVTKYKKVRLLVNNSLDDTVVVYDLSSNQFPILVEDNKTDFWVRLTNTNIIEKPVVELRISPQSTRGKDQNTEFVFGVSERIIKVLSGGNNTKSLRVEAKIVKKST